MVGFEPTKENSLPKLAYGAAGASSGIITRVVAQPLDVLKIRFQLQAEPISSKSSSSKYRSFIQACQTIHTEEGPRAFWKGHLTAQMLSISFGVVQLPHSLTTDYRPVTHSVCGSIAGCMATLTSHPFDVLRTRFVAQGEPSIYKSINDAIIIIIRTDGYRGFYRGLGPNLLQIVPYSGLQFGFYSLFIKLWEDVSPRTLPMPGFTESLLCGASSGLCSKLIVYPLDVVKKRLQVQGWNGRAMFGSSYTYTGMLNCISCVVKREGLRGLYKGLGISLLKSIVVAAISFSAYEQCCNVFIRIYSHVT